MIWAGRTWIAGGYCLAVALSVALAYDAIASVKELIKLVENFILYFAFAEVMRVDQSKDKYERAGVIWMTAFAIIVLIAAAIQIRFMRETLNPLSDDETARRYFRFGWGTFAYSNYFAGMLLLLIPFAVYGASMGGPPARRRLAAGAGVLFAISLVLTFSRGGLLAA